MKLDNKFTAVRTNILMIQPLPTISMAYKLLIQEEKQRQASLIDEESSNRDMVFAADYKRNYKNRYQESRMTFQSSNGNRLVVAGKRPYCEHCRLPGHTIERCFKLHGYPSTFSKEKVKKVTSIAQMEEGNEEIAEHVTHISSDQFNSILKALKA